jgi:hypothetical protein
MPTSTRHVRICRDECAIRADACTQGHCQWFHGSVSGTLSDLVREKWSSLLVEEFDVIHDDGHRVVLESAAVQLVAVHDPRDEVDVAVSPRGHEWPRAWSYSGMVGSASLGRLLEMALDEMRTDPAILRGDADFYEGLALHNESSSRAWTEYYSGRGPRPGTRHLP